MKTSPAAGQQFAVPPRQSMNKQHLRTVQHLRQSDTSATLQVHVINSRLEYLFLRIHQHSPYVLATNCWFSSSSHWEFPLDPGSQVGTDSGDSGC